MTQTTSRSSLRKQLRAARRGLSPLEQKHASRAVDRLISQQSWFINSQDIALYLACDGEIDAQLIAKRAWAMGKRCYLPVLRPEQANKLWFVPYTAKTVLQPNRFGIPEPACDYKTHRPAWSLDLVLMPLVGFDEQGNRLGMGGGFYDRSFAFMQSLPAMRQPRLVGLAHDCQRCEALDYAAWDIPLKAVLSDKRIY